VSGGRERVFDFGDKSAVGEKGILQFYNFNFTILPVGRRLSMPPIRLPKAKGFPYRFGQNLGCTPYLQHLEDDLLGTSDRNHRSTITLKLIRQDILKFSNFSKDLTNDTLFQLAVHKVSDDFRLPSRVPLIHLNDIFEKKLAIWKSSPGLPYRLMGFKTKGEVRDDFHQRNNIRLFCHQIKTGKRVAMPDCCAYVRSHLAPPGEEKVRAVWGYPMALTLAEAIFAIPLTDAYRTHRKPIAYGFETAMGGTRRVLARFGQLKNISALDFSCFDKTVPKWLVDAAFYVLEQNLDFTKYRDYGAPNVVGILRLWDTLKQYWSNRRNRPVYIPFLIT